MEQRRDTRGPQRGSPIQPRLEGERMGHSGTYTRAVCVALNPTHYSFYQTVLVIYMEPNMFKKNLDQPTITSLAHK